MAENVRSDINQSCLLNNTKGLKARKLDEEDAEELGRINDLIAQLENGSFSRELDHPYYVRYREMEQQKHRKRTAAAKRLDFQREMVQHESLATQKRLHLALAEEERIAWQKLRSASMNLPNTFVLQPPRKIPRFTLPSDLESAEEDENCLKADLRALNNA